MDDEDKSLTGQQELIGSIIVTGETEGTPITEEIEVTIGFKDDDYTQIMSGLAEGDEVLVGELAPPTIQFGGFGGND